MSAVVPRSRSTDRRYYGVTEAIVEEIFDPEDEGRVRVSFPWFDESMVTEWCRVATLYAGNGYGSFYVPEVGDEVLVAFVHGDMRFPVIVGGLYNGQDKPPSARKQDRDQKLIKTKGGHSFLMDDSSDALRVSLETAGGHTVDLDDTGGKLEIATSGGHTVSLDDVGGTVTIETSSGQSITLSIAGSITISATSVTIDASQIGLGNGASHPLVFGDLLLALFNAHVHTTTAPGSPTSPPVTPMLPSLLSTVTKTA